MPLDKLAWREKMRSVIITCGVLLLLTSSSSAQEVDSLLAKIKAVGKEGAGNVEAAAAWKELVARGPSVMPDGARSHG